MDGLQGCGFGGFAIHVVVAIGWRLDDMKFPLGAVRRGRFRRHRQVDQVQSGRVVIVKIDDADGQRDRRAVRAGRRQIDEAEDFLDF